MSFICRGKLVIVLKDVTKKSVSRGKKQTNEKKQTQVSSKKTNIKKPATKSKKKTVIPKKAAGKSEPKEPRKVKVKTVNMETAPESSTETDIHHNSNDLSTKESEGTVNIETAPESSTETDIHHHSNDLSTKESEGTVNMETAPESSTETDIHHHSNDFSTKESEGTVNMETAPESSTETDIHNDSNDLSTKESSGEKGEKEVNSGVVSWPTQTKKNTLVKMVDLGWNLDCSESESESKSKGESGTIIEHKILLQQEIKEPKLSKTLVNYTESSDTSDNCPQNVECDLKTDSPNFKDPLISGKLPPDAQPSSDCEEQDDISSQMGKLEGKSAKKIKNEEDLFSSDEDNGSISIVDEIISKLDVNKLVKDQLVSKSMEAWHLDNSKQLLSEAIHHSAIVVSETGEEIQKVPVESTSDTTTSSAQSNSNSDEPLIIIRRSMKNK